MEPPKALTQAAVPDSSPWISYVGKWGDSDAATQFYTNGTFHFTQEPGAYATFAFNGTAVYLYGAHRQNHVRDPGRLRVGHT